MAQQKIVVSDGRGRCKWAATDPMLAAYHDVEWGRPINTDAGHLERMALEVFQCGLSWKIVLVKRPAFRELFKGFDPAKVARFGRREVERLCGDPSIIRNRLKIEAIVANAKMFLKLAGQHGSYRRWFNALAAETPREQKGLYPLFKETFKFMGPETTKCYLMGVGKIDCPHERGCWKALPG
jgi:DNA-3-methyladenine glycosylase I